VDLENALFSEPAVVIYREDAALLQLGWKVKVHTSMFIPAWQGALTQ